MNFPKDHLVIGLLSGLLAPAAAFYVYCRSSFPEISFTEVMLHFDERNVLSHAISLSVIVDLLVFFIFIWLHKDRSAKGVLGATILYALLIVYLKFR